MFYYRQDDCWTWLDVTGLDNVGENLPDESRLQVKGYASEIQKASPGQIFKFQHDGKSVHFFPKGNPYEGMWQNRDDVATMRARHEGYELERKGKELMTKERNKKYHLEVLDPIREAYQSLPAPAKAQLLAQIVRYLTS